MVALGWTHLFTPCFLLAGTVSTGAMVRRGPLSTGRPVATPTRTLAHSPTLPSATGTNESLGEEDEKLEGIESVKSKKTQNKSSRLGSDMNDNAGNRPK